MFDTRRARTVGALLLVYTGACSPDGARSRVEADTTSARGSTDAVGPVPQARGCEASGFPRAVGAPALRETLDGSWDEGWFSSPALVDLDGDGGLDVVAPRHSVLYAWRGDGTPLWRAAFGFGAAEGPDHGSARMYASPVAGDLDGDGRVEIAVAASPTQDGGSVALYDAHGELRPGWPVVHGAHGVRSLAGADIDGDGTIEVLASANGARPSTIALDANGAPLPGWPQADGCDQASKSPCLDYGGYHQNLAAADLDGDGAAEVIVSWDAAGFGLFDGRGAPWQAEESFFDPVVGAVEAYHDLAEAQQGWGEGDRSEFTFSPPVLADIDGDGRREIVLAGDHERPGDTTVRGTSTWVLRGDLTRPAGWETPRTTAAPLAYGELGHNIVALAPSPAVADLDGEPGLEIVVPAYDGRLHVYDATGTERWSWTFDEPGEPYVGATEPLIADLSGDGLPEIVLATWTAGSPEAPDTTPHLVILSATGALLHQVPLPGRGSMAAPSIGDLDGDGQLELVVNLKDRVADRSGVQVWDLPGATPGCLPWPTGRATTLRTGAP